MLLANIEVMSPPDIDVSLLQVLPPKASKAAGVEKLLEHLGIKAENLMALGDGENDIGMLKVRSALASESDQVIAMFDF